MEWVQFISLLVTILGGFGFLYREMKEIERQIREDVKVQSQRSDKLYETFQSEMISQTQRSDRLYEMFIDLIKAQKPRTDP